MAKTEKARANGPIPEFALAGASINPDINSSLRVFQASRLVRFYAVNASMAEALAPLVFLEVLR